ncbi:hypothetical protein B0J13DRAFT_638734 [Dactylonectria estremocensis]|uniref:Uncharacterized protein n=1 Tax=Dactylonectria estremocensis TaxID=1079267 RepID=A0A9P9EL11_9HYPO|nr:hypothetical protein B0J13DRAFT_638734 [Dactylonectria estremocensis]
MHFFKSLLASGAFLGAVQASPALKARDGVPNCDDWSQTYGGKYSDDSGTYVTSDGVSHPYKFPKVRKCWYDYFIVDAAVVDLEWQKASGNIFCTGTSTCVATKLSSAQVCQSRSTAVSANVGFEIEGFSMGLSVTLTTEESRCETASDTTACTWTDGQCHTVWTQQQVLRQNGYRRQRCNWGNGDETQCMADWTQDTPTTFINYGCGSACSDSNTCGNTDGSSC